MEEVLAIIIQILLEVLFEAFSALPVDLFLFGYEEDKPETRTRITLFGLGAGGGWLSAWLLPGTLLHHGWSRLANLAAAPLLAGWIAVVIARWLVRGGREASPRFQFWRAFWFTLGFALLRFAYARRG